MGMAGRGEPTGQAADGSEICDKWIDSEVKWAGANTNSRSIRESTRLGGSEQETREGYI